LAQAEVIILPAKTTSFQNWASRLNEYARSGVIDSERPYWTAAEQSQISPVPVDYFRGENLEESTETVSVSLSIDETRAILQKVSAAYGTQINDVLLAALAEAFANCTGSTRLLVDLEGHGREEIIEATDLSRTVGWFTTIFPVILECPAQRDSGASLKAVKEQLRRVPQRGIGYGLLRYLRAESTVATELEALPQPQVSFNYLGQFGQDRSNSMFSVLAENTGPTNSPRQLRKHQLDVNAIVVGGQLRVDWTYSKNLHRRETINAISGAFISALQTIIAQCPAPGAGGYTPSDFPDVELDQAELDLVLAEIDFDSGDLRDEPEGH
jgi:non-ribosomal peptide synthase protein (TIGR01720 family)